MGNMLYKILNYFLISLIIFPIIVYADSHEKKLEWADKNKDGFDDNTGLDKKGYANTKIPIPSSTTEFKLKKGSYTTEDGTKLTVSSETKVTRNTDGSFNIGGSKVSGSDISYTKGQYTINGEGTFDNIPVSNIKNVHYTVRQDEKIIIVGEAGDEPSAFDKNVFKPKGTVFIYKKSITSFSSEINFLTDTTLIDLDSSDRRKAITVRAIGTNMPKVTLPSGHILEKGSVTFQGGNYVIQDSATINGVSIKKIESPYGLVEPIKLSTSEHIPSHGTFVHMDKDNLAVRMNTPGSFQDLFIMMEGNNPYTPEGLSFLVGNGGGLDIKKSEQKVTPFVRLLGNAHLWNDRFLFRSNGKDIQAYANDLLESSQSLDLEVEFADFEGKKLLPENLKIMDGSLATKDLIINSMGFDRKKHNAHLMAEGLHPSITTTIMPELTDAIKRLPEQSISDIYVQLLQTRQFERRCPPSASACASFNFINLQLGGKLDSSTIHHELSHVYHYINNAANRPIYEGKGLTEMWKLVSGDVFGRGYISNSGAVNDKDHLEDIADTNTDAKYSPDYLKLDVDPRFKAKLKLLVAGQPPLMIKEQYEDVAKEPYSSLSQKEILEILNLQEQLGQLTPEGRAELAKLRR